MKLTNFVQAACQIIFTTYHPNAKTTLGSFISCKSPPWSNILGSGSGSGLKQEQNSIKVFSGFSFQNEARGESPFAVGDNLGMLCSFESPRHKFCFFVSNWTLHGQQNSQVANWKGIPWSSTSSYGSFSAIISSIMMTIFPLFERMVKM